MRNDSQSQIQAYDIIGGRPLINCPFSTSSIPTTDSYGDAVFHNPTISATNFIFVFTFLLFSLLTLFKYCFVKIFNRVIRDPSVSNYYFVGFYLVLGVASMIDGVRYSLDLPMQMQMQINNMNMLDLAESNSSLVESGEEEDRYIVGPEVIDSWLLLASTILRSLALFILTLSLNHQKNYKSIKLPSAPLSHSLVIPRVSDSESAPLLLNSPTFDATPIIPAPIAELNQNDDNQRVEADHADDLQIEESIISKKLTSVIQYFAEIYSFLNSSGWLFPIIAFSSFLLRIFTLISLIDPTRLSDFDGASTFISSGGIDIFAISILGSLIQLAPTIFVTFSIIIHGEYVPTNTDGPSLLSKFILVASLLLTIPFWIEPSILCRMVTDYIVRNTHTEAMCAVPPWWWQRMKGFSLTIIPAHGWASYVDFLLWVAGFGVFGLFSFMKLEYNRNADQWIAATVSEVQSTFGFY